MVGDDYGYEREDVIEIPYVELLHMTEKGIKVRLESGEVHWIPKVWVSEETELYNRGDVGSLILASWWAQENGIEP